MDELKNKRSVIWAWFLCGITSAVACKLAIDEYGKDVVKPYYIHIDSAHDDNDRFISDCEKWFGTSIIRVRNNKYKDQFDVIEKERFVNGPTGAACTKILKKQVRFDLERASKPDIFDFNKPTVINQVHGFEWDLDQINRAIDFKMDYGYTNPLFPLIERRINKNQAAKMIIDAGIDLPAMYLLGYSNNNCIGCVKGGKGYWNKVRIDFPAVFERMAKLERKIGHTCIKGIYLDELDPKAGYTPNPVVPGCSVVCDDILPPDINMNKAKKVYYGLASIYEV